MKNIEFEIAVKKLDLLENKICFAENELSEKKDNLFETDFISVQFLKLFDDFALDFTVFNEILKYAEKFCQKNGKQYSIDSNRYTKLKQSIDKDKRRFDKISNQLEFLHEKQR